jgi:hypothetical protein
MMVYESLRPGALIMTYHLRTAGGALMGAVFVCSLILAIVDGEHIIRNKLPSSWDEAYYINDVCTEHFLLRREGLWKFAKSFISISPQTPPGYRMAAVPTLLVAEPNPIILKTLAAVSFIFSAAILFFAGRQIGNPGTGLVWSSAFAFSVGPFHAAAYFGTETTLYPAVAGCLYAVARWFRKDYTDISTLVALALSTAVGSLSKASFFVILIPLVGAAMLAAPSNDKRFRSWLAISMAVGCGILVAAPWWLVDWRAAYDYANFASAFYRHGFPWASEVATNLFGVPITILLLGSLIWVLSRVRELWIAHDGIYSSFVLVCLAGFLPLTVLHIAGANHNMRLLTPALIPFTGIVAILLDVANLYRRSIFAAFAIPLLVAQTWVVAWLSIHNFNNNDDQWDWHKLRALARTNGLSRPKIVNLGLGPAFNPPQIQYPWVCHGDAVSAQWLWSIEQGPLDWRKIDEQIDRADIVLTIPGFLGVIKEKDDLDNAHNEELSRRLLSKPNVWKSISVDVDPSGKWEVMAFLRKPQPHL